jgi:tetratricopeptide (TPR) repeat protein
MDVAPLIGSFADPRVRGAWESFIARYGADAVYAVAGMRQTAGQQENAIRAFSLLLSAVPAVDVARSMVPPDAGAARGPFRELLAGAADRVPDPPILMRICEILLLLWWYPDIPDVASRAYGASRNDAFVGFAAAGIRRGGDMSIPADALRRLVASRARPDRDAAMVFWVRVARETGHMASIRGILRPADAHQMKPSDAATLAENLGAADEMDEIDRLFSDAPSPALIYLRARFGSSPEGVAGVSVGVSSAIEALNPESAWFSSEAFDLGELMERFGDAGPAERVWRRLIEQPDDRTVYAANARLRLARRAEARGDLPGALELCEEALSISRDLGAESTVTGPGGGRGTEWLMRVILDLRRKIGEHSRMAH